MLGGVGVLCGRVACGRQVMSARVSGEEIQREQGHTFKIFRNSSTLLHSSAVTHSSRSARCFSGVDSSLLIFQTKSLRTYVYPSTTANESKGGGLTSRRSYARCSIANVDDHRTRMSRMRLRGILTPFLLCRSLSSWVRFADDRALTASSRTRPTSSRTTRIDTSVRFERVSSTSALVLSVLMWGVLL